MSTWHARGTVLIACNCDWGCPCNFNARPTHGACEGGWLWLLDEAEVAGVSLADRAVAVMAAWPGAIHEGGGQAVAYVDDGADEEQAAALTSLVRGEVGGPWAVFVNTYDLDGPHRARFETALDEYATRASIEGAVELELQPMRNPVTGVEAHPEIVLPEGLVVKRGALAASKVFRVHDGVTYDHSGQYAAFGAFDYRS